MSNILSIRKRLGLSQAQLAAGIGMTQGNVGHMERGVQSVRPEVAEKLIAFAATRGVRLTFDDVYRRAEAAQQGA